MVEARNEDGNIILDGDTFSLKIDVNRIEYIKKEGSDHFVATGKVIPKGYSSKEKMTYINKLYLMIKDKQIQKDRLK